MELHAWLDAEKGRASWLAEQTGRGRAAVSLWRTEGVPLAMIPRVAELSGGAVSEDEMLRHAMQCRLARAA